MKIRLEHPDKLYIGGQWIKPLEDASVTITAPYSEEAVYKVAKAGLGDVEIAIQSARKAFDDGPWPRLSARERGEKLRQIGRAMSERSEDFALAWTEQVGVPFSQSNAVAGFFGGYFDYFAGLAEKGLEDVRDTLSGDPCIVVHEPVGVVVAIVPWNAPLATLLLKVAPALAAGCTVIAKPATETPLEALILAECIDKCGLPPGVFNVLTADREVADQLIRSRKIDKVSFTGSTTAGLHIASVCAANSTRVVTELGGKSAAIVLEDGNTELVVKEVMATLIGVAGQQCSAFSRILVPNSRKEEITAAFEYAFKSVVVGEPFDPATQMGPIVSKKQWNSVCDYIDRGIKDGAKLVTGGRFPENHSKGYFVQPTLFADVSNKMTIAQEEIFGPVGVIIGYDSLEEAIQIANDSDYGLHGAVFTEDVEKAYVIARSIRTGNFGHNGRVVDYTMPYGGFKLSGIGREGGIEGLYAFTEIKSIFMKSLPKDLRTETAGNK